MTHPMDWTRRELLALGGLALGGTALAPSRALSQAPRRGGTLTVRGWDPPLFDAMLTTAYRVHVALSLTHSRLVKHRAGPAVAPGTFAIEGDLAESWSQPSETTYVFKLRRGVRWHPKPPVNGREFTSADVKYTIERFLSLKGYYVQLASAVTIAVWDGALKNYGPNHGYDYGGRLMAAWLDR